MKVFISGPMRGIKNDNKPALDEAELKLRSYGLDVFNPAWMLFTSGWNRNDILPIDIAALSKCDAIFQLPGWEKAGGAVLEYQYAVTTNKLIFTNINEVIAILGMLGGGSRED